MGIDSNIKIPFIATNINLCVHLDSNGFYAASNEPQ